MGAKLVALWFFLAEAVADSGSRRAAIYVKRASGHSGSRWIAMNLAAANMSTFFQFGGLCDDRCCLPTGPPGVTAEERLGALRRLFSTGCECMYARDEGVGDARANERTMTCGRWQGHDEGALM